MTLASLLFVHGSGCSAAVWSEQAKRFSLQRDVLSVDLPGRGDTDSQMPSDFAGLVAFVHERAKLLSRPVIIGHSLGGSVALQVVLDHPDSFSGLVLVGAALKVSIPPSLQAMVLADYEAALAALRPALFSRATDPSNVGRGMDIMQRVPAQALTSDLRAAASFDFTDTLAPLGKPALVVVGQDDRVTRPDAARELAKALGAEFQTITEAGHMVMFERPAEFNACLEGFLAQVDREAALEVPT